MQPTLTELIVVRKFSFFKFFSLIIANNNFRKETYFNVKFFQKYILPVAIFFHMVLSTSVWRLTRDKKTWLIFAGNISRDSKV